MFRRHKKGFRNTALIVLIAFLNQTLLLEPLWAAWTCVETQRSFSTEEECNDYCEGLCLGDDESQAMSCAIDSDNDDLIEPNEFIECEEINTCPLGNYECNPEDNTCIAVGICTSSSETVTLYRCPQNNHVYETKTDCTSNCIKYVCSSTGNEFTSSTECNTNCPGSCSQTDSNTVYSCSLDGSTYSSSSDCISACQGSCSQQTSTSYYCSANNQYYATSSACGSSCNLWDCRDDWGILIDTFSNRADCEANCSAQDLHCVQRTVACSESSSTNYICSLSGISYSDATTCQNNCTGSCSSTTTYTYTCNETGINYSNLSTCQNNCGASCNTQAVACVSFTETNTYWECSINENEYDTEEQCTENCQETAECEISYVCPGHPEIQCINIASSSAITTSQPDISSYEDDGEVNDNGECEGQFFIFAGSPSTCRPPGWSTRFRNCCDADEDIVEDLSDSLSMLSNTFGTVKKIQEAVEVAQQAVKIYNTTMSLLEGYSVSAEAVTNTINAVRTSYQFTEAAATGAKAAISVSSTGTVVGAGASAAATQALMSMLASTVYGIIIAVILKFAMEWFFTGCDADDLMTAAYDEMGLCHYIGKKCVKKTIFGCLQKKKMYCCFNSKLARIIHEQGRNQLIGFSQEGWGSFSHPNCRGFTPEEIQMIDFAKIDFSEWYSDIETTVQEDIQNQTMQKIEQFHQNIK